MNIVGLRLLYVALLHSEEIVCLSSPKGNMIELFEPKDISICEQIEYCSLPLALEYLYNLLSSGLNAFQILNKYPLLVRTTLRPD